MMKNLEVLEEIRKQGKNLIETKRDEFKKWIQRIIFIILILIVIVMVSVLGYQKLSFVSTFSTHLLLQIFNFIYLFILNISPHCPLPFSFELST